MSIWSWWAKERVEIDQKIGGEFKRTGDMVDRLSSIVAHDEWVVSKCRPTVGTQFVETTYPLPAAGGHH